MNKVNAILSGLFGGSSFSIVINWEHIFEKGIETAILSAIGGITGAIGGLVVYWVVKKVKQLMGWNESANTLPTEKP